MSEATIESLQKQIEAQAKELEGLQTLKGNWSNEIGESRKRLKDFEDQMKVLTEDRDAVNKELQALKSKESSSGGQEQPPTKVPDKDIADKLESELTDDERKAVEALLADDKDAQDFVSNDAFRRKLLEGVKAGSGSVPQGIWRVKKATPLRDDVDERIKKLLKKSKGEHIPADERGGSGGTRRTEQRKEREPVKSWV